MNEDPVVPIIHGRPFLAIARALINVKQKLIVLEVGNENEPPPILEEVAKEDAPREAPQEKEEFLHSDEE
ncbi:hypothetical protein A2U01_0057918, partial [Trifolium medium]|nr:hypothetical protein [Trifolium medium]